MRVRFWLAAGASVAVAGATSAFLLHPRLEAQTASASNAARAYAPADTASVSVARATRGDFVVRSTSAGTIVASRSVGLLAEAGGRVVAVGAREGDRVAAGSVVLRVDDVGQRLELQTADAALAVSGANYEDLVGPRPVGGGAQDSTRRRMARARSGVAAAELAQQRARLEMERTTLRAPFPGVLGDLHVVAGQQVQAGQAIAQLVSIDTVMLNADVLETELPRVLMGMPALVHVAAFPDRSFWGHVTGINPIVDAQHHTARVTVVIPNPAHRILPGMYASVDIEIARLPNRLLVPASAVLRRQGRTVVFVVRGSGRHGTAEWRYVTVRQTTDSVADLDVERAGVQEGDEVVVEGGGQLVHGMPVVMRKPAADSRR